MQQTLKNVEDLERYLNQNNIQFPTEWKKKLTIKKRKTRDNSEWKDFRMCFYAASRVMEIHNFIFYEEMKFIKKVLDKISNIQTNDKVKLQEILNKKNDYDFKKLEPTKEKELKKKMYDLKELTLLLKDRIYSFDKNIYNIETKSIYKKGGKLFFKFKHKKKLLKLFKTFKIKKIPLTLKLPSKKKSIIYAMENVEYWQARNAFLDLPIKDMDNKNIFRKEAQQYFKSVCNYIVKEEHKYNKIFFQKHQKPLVKMWNNYWELYKKVR